MEPNAQNPEPQEPEENLVPEEQIPAPEPEPQAPPPSATSPFAASAPGTVAPQTPDERTLGMLCHLSALAGLLIPVLGNIIGPLIVWLVRKNDYPFVDDQGKESLNFQLSVLIYGAALSVLTVLTIGTLAIVTIPLLIVLSIFDLVFVIIASINANNGIAYRYPLTIRMIK